MASIFGDNPGDSNNITRDFLDSLLVETRYIDADIPSTQVTILGETFDTPIATAALSHLNNVCKNGMAEYAKGAKDAGAVHFMGMGEDSELESVTATGARTIKIIKPHADNNEVFRKIEHAVKNGAFGVGMDIDHAFNSSGDYDNVNGLAMHPKTLAELKSFVKASPLPFVVKGVLSVSDAQKCIDAGVKGIVVSHHHGIMPFSVPPLMVLPQIKKAVGKDLTIFVDCGIASSMDVFKALALGADCVSIGRALMEVLKGGSSEVTSSINTMTAELASLMARTGFSSVSAMNDSVIHRRTF